VLGPRIGHSALLISARTRAIMRPWIETCQSAEAATPGEVQDEPQSVTGTTRTRVTCFAPHLREPDLERTGRPAGSLPSLDRRPNSHLSGRVYSCRSGDAVPAINYPDCSITSATDALAVAAHPDIVPTRHRRSRQVHSTFTHSYRWSPGARFPHDHARSCSAHTGLSNSHQSSSPHCYARPSAQPAGDDGPLA
jgi:hypothetical protein